MVTVSSSSARAAAGKGGGLSTAPGIHGRGRGAPSVARDWHAPASPPAASCCTEVLHRGRYRAVLGVVVVVNVTVLLLEAAGKLDLSSGSEMEPEAPEYLSRGMASVAASGSGATSDPAIAVGSALRGAAGASGSVAVVGDYSASTGGLNLTVTRGEVEEGGTHEAELAMVAGVDDDPLTRGIAHLGPDRHDVDDDDDGAHGGESSVGSGSGAAGSASGSKGSTEGQSPQGVAAVGEAAGSSAGKATNSTGAVAIAASPAPLPAVSKLPGCDPELARGIASVIDSRHLMWSHKASTDASGSGSGVYTARAAAIVDADAVQQWMQLQTLQLDLAQLIAVQASAPLGVRDDGTLPEDALLEDYVSSEARKSLSGTRLLVAAPTPLLPLLAAAVQAHATVAVLVPLVSSDAVAIAEGLYKAAVEATGAKWAAIGVAIDFGALEGGVSVVEAACSGVPFADCPLPEMASDASNPVSDGMVRSRRAGIFPGGHVLFGRHHWDTLDPGRVVDDELHPRSFVMGILHGVLEGISDSHRCSFAAADRGPQPSQATEAAGAAAPSGAGASDSPNGDGAEGTRERRLVVALDTPAVVSPRVLIRSKESDSVTLNHLMSTPMATAIAQMTVRSMAPRDDVGGQRYVALKMRKGSMAEVESRAYEMTKYNAMFIAGPAHMHLLLDDAQRCVAGAAAEWGVEGAATSSGVQEEEEGAESDLARQNADWGRFLDSLERMFPAELAPWVGPQAGGCSAGLRAFVEDAHIAFMRAGVMLPRTYSNVGPARGRRVSGEGSVGGGRDVAGAGAGARDTSADGAAGGGGDAGDAGDASDAARPNSALGLGRFLRRLQESAMQLRHKVASHIGVSTAHRRDVAGAGDSSSIQSDDDNGGIDGIDRSGRRLWERKAVSSQPASASAAPTEARGRPRWTPPASQAATLRWTGESPGGTTRVTSSAGKLHSTVVRTGSTRPPPSSVRPSTYPVRYPGVVRSSVGRPKVRASRSGVVRKQKDAAEQKLRYGALAVAIWARRLGHACDMRQLHDRLAALDAASERVAVAVAAKTELPRPAAGGGDRGTSGHGGAPNPWHADVNGARTALAQRCLDPRVTVRTSRSSASCTRHVGQHYGYTSERSFQGAVCSCDVFDVTYTAETSSVLFEVTSRAELLLARHVLSCGRPHVHAPAPESDPSLATTTSLQVATAVGLYHEAEVTLITINVVAPEAPAPPHTEWIRQPAYTRSPEPYQNLHHEFQYRILPSALTRLMPMREWLSHDDMPPEAQVLTQATALVDAPPEWWLRPFIARNGSDACTYNMAPSCYVMAGLWRAGPRVAATPTRFSSLRFGVAPVTVLAKAVPPTSGAAAFLRPGMDALRARIVEQPLANGDTERAHLFADSGATQGGGACVPTPPLVALELRDDKTAANGRPVLNADHLVRLCGEVANTTVGTYLETHAPDVKRELEAAVTRAGCDVTAALATRAAVCERWVFKGEAQGAAYVEDVRRLDVYVAPHGSGWTNTALMRPGTSAVLLSSRWPFFFGMGAGYGAYLMTEMVASASINNVTVEHVFTEPLLPLHLQNELRVLDGKVFSKDDMKNAVVGGVTANMATLQEALPRALAVQWRRRVAGFGAP